MCGTSLKPLKQIFFDVLFEKNQKGLFFSLAQRKELKETSTLTKPSPLYGKDVADYGGNRPSSEFW